jgi:hypothetical protein
VQGEKVKTLLILGVHPLVNALTEITGKSTNKLKLMTW